jgi:hypothetical protein
MNWSKLHFVVADIVDILPSYFYKGQRRIEHFIDNFKFAPRCENLVLCESREI